MVSATHQTAGKGQAGTVWESQPGLNFTFSLIYYPTFLAPANVFDLNRAVCIGLVTALRKALPGKVIATKWPNDIYVDDRKICGILIRNQFISTSVQTSIIGVGLNVDQTIFPPDFAHMATSYRLEGGKFTRNELWIAIFEGIEQYYLMLRAGRIALIEQEYLQNLYKYQEYAKYRIGEKIFEAMLVGVDRSGRMALQIDGKLNYFGLKEVELCR